jgi:hypothetical protein
MLRRKPALILKRKLRQKREPDLSWKQRRRE